MKRFGSGSGDSHEHTHVGKNTPLGSREHAGLRPGSGCVRAGKRLVLRKSPTQEGATGRFQKRPQVRRLPRGPDASTLDAGPSIPKVVDRIVRDPRSK
jgi:hypothetical protein